MSMWILAIVLLGLFAALGFVKGAIRTSISLVGVILGIMLAVPLSGVIKPILGPLGVKNPVWLTLVPPLVVFLFIYFIFIGISFAVHHKVHLFYKYKRDDTDRIRWERVNKHSGIAVGLLTGAIYFFAICALIYAAGYLTVQLSAEENNPAVVKFINSARGDMAQSGLDKAVAVFDPGSKLFYDAADIFGLLYHNPLLQSRLATYPYFLSLGQRPEFQEISTDKEYNDLIFGKAPVTQIIDHPRTQSLLGNSEVMTYLKGTDIKDLKEYLRTGKSPKYDDEEILGVWNFDKDAVLTHIRKTKPDMKARELMMLKKIFDALPPISLIATPPPENKIIVQAAVPPPAETTEAAPTPDPATDPMARYRQSMPAPTPAPAPAQPEPQQSIVPQLSGEGTWKEDAGLYTVTLPDASGKQYTGTVTINADEMALNIGGTTLVFIKQ